MATIAITGANSGIGLRAARRLSDEGHRVLALCRSVDRAREALGDSAEIIECDVSSLESVERAAHEVAPIGLDVLINNAAVFDLGAKERVLSVDGHELVWATDHLGSSALTARLSESLIASRGRVVFIASKGLLASPGIAIRWDDVDGAGWYTPTKAYYQAKLAQVMTALELAERAGDRLEVACLRVPAVRLDAAKIAAQPALMRWLYAPKNAMAVPPEEVGEVYARLATQEAPGSVYVDEALAAAAPPRFARDADNRARLWDMTQEITGVAWADGI